MSAELELFQTHYRRRLANTPRRLKGWLERVRGLSEPRAVAELVSLDQYRARIQGPLSRTPNWAGGYPPVYEKAQTQHERIAEALFWHGINQPSWNPQPPTVLKCDWRTKDREATVLAFPFSPHAVLRNPRMRLASPKSSV
jgi:hypothetical protein